MKIYFIFLFTYLKYISFLFYCIYILFLKYIFLKIFLLFYLIFLFMQLARGVVFNSPGHGINTPFPWPWPLMAL